MEYPIATRLQRSNSFDTAAGFSAMASSSPHSTFYDASPSNGTSSHLATSPKTSTSGFHPPSTDQAGASSSSDATPTPSSVSTSMSRLRLSSSPKQQQQQQQQPHATTTAVGGSSGTAEATIAAVAAAAAEHATDSTVIDPMALASLFADFFQRPDLKNRTDRHLLQVQQNVEILFNKDYYTQTIDNYDGTLCNSYPLSLIVIEGERKESTDLEWLPKDLDLDLQFEFDTAGSDWKLEQTPLNDAQIIKEHMENCRFSRVRLRFVAPVILCRNKNICRSSTLSQEVEVLLNMAADTTFRYLYGANDLPPEIAAAVANQDFQRATQFKSQVENQRKADIDFLKVLKVQRIFDLMVEARKLKYGIYVCSSEKADSKRRYRDFDIVCLPYPGCEFFVDFKNNGHCANELMFDWTQPQVNAKLEIPPSIRGPEEWEKYQTWDLIRLTKAYLLSMLRDLDATIPGNELGEGMLVHCISGWDRTPLFISLLRISLWADGEVHQTLTVSEMLYLTVGYDWALFNHLLVDRTRRGEDIFAFCFYFLMHMESEEFCLHELPAQQTNLAPELLSCPVHGDAITRSRSGTNSSQTGADDDNLNDVVFVTIPNSVTSNRSIDPIDGSYASVTSFESSVAEPTPMVTVSTCRCCSSYSDGGCTCSILRNKTLSEQRRMRLIRRRQRLRAIRHDFFKLYQTFATTVDSQKSGVLAWLGLM